LAIDENDDLLVRGLSTTNGARFTSFLGKFSGLDGSALWQVETPELDGGTVASLPGGKFALATNTVEANGETPVSTRLLVLVFRDDPAPHLAVFAQSGSVRIAWLQSAAGWNLEQRTGLDPNSEWLKVVVPQGAASYEAPLAGTDGPMLFRLSRPE
jgi:hypothetical protein